ncbi:4691_t:CDS:2 [Funneliformis mosseae]|uniref:4691_t:CDS:1 n=1 Tax=Funneliformis mosseae TaxID=27381 RepID=A0A9N8VEE5_FUNMO|nr:4691_t:CDS:2 [Funneliformis mosseae]
MTPFQNAPSFKRRLLHCALRRTPITYNFNRTLDHALSKVLEQIDELPMIQTHVPTLRKAAT